jgi:hypothetical protein
MSRKRTILMYGRSRAGKTQLLAELAEHVKVTTGLKSLVYSIDKGGIGPMVPLIELGVIDLVEQEDDSPWIFMNKGAKGEIRDKGKWVKADLNQYGLVGYESMTGFSDAFMNDLAAQAAAGVNIGGAANVGFTVSSNGESLKIGGNNMGHYNVVQNRILDEVWRSQRLSVPYIVWTASASRDEDPNATGKVIGPAIAGKALTAEMLRHFDLTFRLDCSPANNGKPEKHTIYLGNSVDIQAGNAVGLGNTRVPLAEGVPPLPPSIEPASLVKALGLIQEVETKAKEVIKKRLEAKK